MDILTLLQYNLYLIFFGYTTLMKCVNLSHIPSKLICLFTNRSPTTYQGYNSTCGTGCIVLREVFPNFFTKGILGLFITVYGINTSIESC